MYFCYLIHKLYNLYAFVSLIKISFLSYLNILFKLKIFKYKIKISNILEKKLHHLYLYKYKRGFS